MITHFDGETFTDGESTGAVVKRWLIAIILTIMAVAGGNVGATIMLSFWMGGGPIASFETPGGIITGLIESLGEIALLEVRKIR